MPSLIARLLAGDHVALVTDAGTPAISDPGFQLVRAAHQQKLRVEAIPGPSAVLTALVSSGLATHEFTFLGFAPARAKDKKSWVAKVVSEPRTVVFFDSPRRVRDTLSRLATVAPEREVVVARELTKKYETLVKGPISAVSNELSDPLRGEITVVLAAGTSVASSISHPAAIDILSNDQYLLGLLTEFEEFRMKGSRKAAIKEIAARRGLAPRSVYAAIEEAKKAAGKLDD